MTVVSLKVRGVQHNLITRGFTQGELALHAQAVSWNTASAAHAWNSAWQQGGDEAEHSYQLREAVPSECANMCLGCSLDVYL